MNSEIKNALIKNASISMADHGCLTYWLNLEFGSCVCSYGGYCIGHGYLGATKFDGSPSGLVAMMRIMDVVGVSRWEDLNGKYVRVQFSGLGKPIDIIGNIIEDKWFNQREFFAGEVDDAQ